MTRSPLPIVLPWNMAPRATIAALRLKIDRWDARRDGPLSGSALRKKLRRLVSHGTWHVYAPGTIVRGSEEKPWLQAVASGLVKVTIDGERALLGPGDVAFVPAGAIRHVEVVGDSAVHCLEAVAEAA